MEVTLVMLGKAAKGGHYPRGNGRSALPVA
jgi:hypothetical protein